MTNGATRSPKLSTATSDVVHSGSILMPSLVCPIQILVSLLKSAIRRPGWGLALARILNIGASSCPHLQFGTRETTARQTYS
jgi:hypothetical protein